MSQVGFGVGIPAGPPVKFAVQTDTFRPVTAAAVVAGGANYAVGDIITLPGIQQGQSPIGAPAQLRVETLSGSAVATVSVVNQVLGSSSPKGGSYFSPQTNPQAQASTTGNGSGATFNLTYGAAAPQRVILEVRALRKGHKLVEFLCGPFEFGFEIFVHYRFPCVPEVP